MSTYNETKYVISIILIMIHLQKNIYIVYNLTQSNTFTGQVY